MANAATATQIKSPAGRKQENVYTGPGYQLAEFLNDNWDEKVGMTNQAVADKLGYKSANIVSMWRTGKTKVALDRLFQVADLMKIDVGILLPMWMEGWMTSEDGKQRSVIGMKRIKDTFARFATEHEMAILRPIRAIFGRKNPQFTPTQLEAIRLIAIVPELANLVVAAGEERGIAKHVAVEDDDDEA